MKYTVEEKVIEKISGSNIKITEQAIFAEKPEEVEEQLVEEQIATEEQDVLLEKHYYHGSGTEKMPVNADGVGVCTRVPRFGDVLDIYGDKIGYIRNGKVYHFDDEYWAHLSKESRGVVFSERGIATGYVDANHNILSFDNDFIGKIKEKWRGGWIAATSIACVFIVCAVVFLAWLAIYGAKDEPTFMTFTEEVVQEGADLTEKLYVFDTKETKKHGDITPNAGNSVIFEIENTTDERVFYLISFNADNMPKEKFAYKLGIDSNLVFGKTGYLDIDEMCFTTAITIEANSKSEFELYWAMQGQTIIPVADFENYYVEVSVQIVKPE